MYDFFFLEEMVVRSVVLAPENGLKGLDIFGVSNKLEKVNMFSGQKGAFLPMS